MEQVTATLLSLLHWTATSAEPPKERAPGPKGTGLCETPIDVFARPLVRVRNFVTIKGKDNEKGLSSTWYARQLWG